MKEQKKALEFQMEQLGISVEKIKEAGLLADMPHVRHLNEKHKMPKKEEDN